MSVPQPGQIAPDFTLPGTAPEPVQLSSLRGAPVLLVFFPFAFSRICTGELCELRDNYDDFAAAGVRTLGISTDPAFTLTAFAQHEGYAFDLLSDFWPHGAVSAAYGVFDEESGHALRETFLIDAGGVVRWATVNPRGVRRDLQGYLDAVAAL